MAAPPVASADRGRSSSVVIVREWLAREGVVLSPESVARALRAQGRPVGDAEVLAIHRALEIEVEGAGPLQFLLADPSVTDVLVNGPESVWIDRGRGLERAPVRFVDDEAVRRLAQRMAAVAGRRLDDAAPWVDLRLPDGVRLHAVLAPIARTGTAVSLRIPGSRRFDLDALRDAGFLSPAGQELLRALVAARAAMIISGGTGSGKTTLLAALIDLVDPRERIVVVEDSAELEPRHPQVVCLEARPANAEGAGLITVRELVRQALRMRPDRVVLGEVRGAEVVDLLAAMNTGHEGCAGTVHANSAADVPARIESLASSAGLSVAAAHSQLGAAVEVICHLARGRSGRRRLAEIAVLERGADGIVATSTAVRFDPDLRATEGPGAARLGQVLDR